MTTRFVILARERSLPEEGGGVHGGQLLFNVRNNFRAVFDTKHLAGLRQQLNLTAIELYVRRDFKRNPFLVDVVRHVGTQAFIRGTGRFSFYSDEIHILGCYPGHTARKTIK